jgi:hypothetical protein
MPSWRALAVTPTPLPTPRVSGALTAALDDSGRPFPVSSIATPVARYVYVRMEDTGYEKLRNPTGVPDTSTK